MEKRIATLGDSLLQINPEIKFTYLGDDYNTLQILSDHEKPTQEEIESAKVKAQKKIDDSYYKIQRASQYPSITDVVIALAEKEEGDDSAWQEISVQRAKVKKDYPKPQN